MTSVRKLTQLAVTPALIAAGVGLAVPAQAADPNAVGTYTFESADGESAKWVVTPCADDTPHCVHVSETENSLRAPWSANAYWTVGSWILFVDQPDAIICNDGGAAPGVNNYSWDATSLAGYASIFNKDGACGIEPSSLTIPFTLTKTGSGPIQYPTAPVQDQPYVVDIPEPYVPGAAEAPPGAAEAQAPAPVENEPAMKVTPNYIPSPEDPLTEGVVSEPGFNR
jgi:hypothetical protein